jgi:propanediol dehydratase small subunit
VKKTLPLLAVLLFTGVSAAGDVEAQAERLAALRSDVEALASELELEKGELTAQLRAIEAQKVDLEVQIRREDLRMERLIAEEASQRALLEDAEGADDLTPVVQEGILTFQDHVRRGLPYQHSARLAALADLESRLQDRSLTTEQVAARLWAFAEDERRLSRENALDRQVIALEDGEVLVDVARLGMVAMYYRTPTGEYGQAVRQGDTWTWQRIQDADDVEQLSELFDALSRGIHVGWFTLPHLLNGATP